MTELQTVNVGSQNEKKKKNWSAQQSAASAQLGTFFGEAWRQRNVERPVKDAGVRKRSASVDQTGGQEGQRGGAGTLVLKTAGRLGLATTRS